MNAHHESPVNRLTELIVYACPVGELADQLDRYFVQSRNLCGENAAHTYMPHISLTGFFHDAPGQIPFYDDTLSALIPDLRGVEPLIRITRMGFEMGFHRLEIEAPQLRALIERFIGQAASASRTDPIRKKDWLHLSLAYEFPPEQDSCLQELAHTLIRPNAPVAWTLRFYERHPDKSWTCHHEWAL